jgi:beta-lactamase regulating signal transducer with metallopeptidase domain
MTHMLQAIAWTLIHFCWQGAAIVIVYLVLAWAVAHRSSQTRYLLSLSMMLLMLVSAAITFAIEIRSNRMPAFTFSDEPAISYSASTGPAFPRIAAPGLDRSALVANRPLASMFPSNALAWIDGFWILGVAILSLRSIGGWWLIQRLRASADAHAPADVEATFQRIASAMGLRRSVLLRITANITGPMTVGTLRAIVLLPLSALTSLGPDELEVVLAHELAHIRRADFFWNLLQTFAETLFFFHPAVWWISGRIRHERELCCDDLALRICPNPVVYARALYRLEEQRSRALRLAMALDGHQSPQTLRLRICRILGEPITQMKNRSFRPLSLAAACGALVVLLLPMHQLFATLNPAQESASAPIIATAPQVGANPVISIDAGKIVEAAPHPDVQVAVHLSESAPIIAPASQAEDKQPQSEDEKPVAPAASKTSYIDQMKAAGYDVDFDKLVAMKIQNVTPEYARAMATAGFGKPTADQLVACKMQGITPEYIAQLKQQGFEVNSLNDAISYKMFHITPEFGQQLKAAGFGDIPTKELMALRIQGVTPEYAREVRQRYPNATAQDLLNTRVFRIDEAFIAAAQKHGFTNLSLQKLVQLRISGLLDDEAK